MLAGEHLDATDFAFPDEVVAVGNGVNVITATSFAELPSPLYAEIVNPHPTRHLLLLVTVGAWMMDNGGSMVRASLRVSGTMSISPGIGGGLAAGWGQIIETADNTRSQRFAMATIRLPPTQPDAPNRTTRFTLEAYRSNTVGTQEVNYPVVELIPLRYV